MPLLVPATNRSAYVKAGFLGFGGSGKTTTAALLAIGLALKYGKHKAVAMLDTETGSDFLIPLFAEHGIAFYPVKSRSFKDLLTVFREGSEMADVILVDSVTHVWRQLCDDYQSAKNRKRLSFKDWAPLKQQWGQFTDAYVNCPTHAIICGRAGFDWDFEEDEDGDKELIKTGIKMKSEGETGYEPSLLIEMQRQRRYDFDEKDPRTHGWMNRAIVLKDRAMQINGAMKDFGGELGAPTTWGPVLSFVEPHIKRLNIGGIHMGVDAARNAESLFLSAESRQDRMRTVQITLELIKDALTEGQISGTAMAAKEQQVKHLKSAFGISSWTAIEGMRLEDLQAGLVALRKNLLLPDLTAEKDAARYQVLAAKGERRTERETEELAALQDAYPDLRPASAITLVE